MISSTRSFFLPFLLVWSMAAVVVQGQTTVPGGSFEDPVGTTSITFQSPSQVFSCQPLEIRWTFNSREATASIPFSITYTNRGIRQPSGSIPSPGDIVEGSITTEAFGENAVFQWSQVLIPQPGLYIFDGSALGVSVVQSDPFPVTLVDTSCLEVPNTTTTSSTSSQSDTASAPSPTPTFISDPPESGSKNNTGAIVGSVLGVIVVLALVAAFFFYRKRAAGKSVYITGSAAEGRPRRKWGGLPSIDNTAQQTGGPVLPPLAYKNASRQDSIGRDDDVEKGSPTVNDEHSSSPLDYVSPLEKRTHSKRYSTGAFTQQLNSGLAAFTHERARSTSLKANATSPTSPEDPFSEEAFRQRAHRSSSLSVPSTAHPSPRSDVPPLPSPAPQFTSRPNSSRGHASSGSIGTPLARSPSGNALARPARKPVPQYDSSIEMTPTNAYSGLGLSASANASAANLSMTNESNGALASSVDSMSPWLQDRAPVASRNIGLAGQGDGPVHYLMPDLPPPQRN